MSMFSFDMIGKSVILVTDFIVYHNKHINSKATKFSVQDPSAHNVKILKYFIYYPVWKIKCLYFCATMETFTLLNIYILANENEFN